MFRIQLQQSKYFSCDHTLLRVGRLRKIEDGSPYGTHVLHIHLVLLSRVYSNKNNRTKCAQTALMIQ
jgi:hypothetical protein